MYINIICLHTKFLDYLSLGSASASDTESLNNEPVPHRLFRNLPARTVQVEEPVNLKKSSGKKKMRRFQNRKLGVYLIID